MNFMSVVYFVLILGVLVLVHEVGHLITAKRFGVYCSEFAIGMGPQLFKKQVGETVYSVRLLPLGGFVSMAGEEGVDEDENIPFERTIKGIKVWQQVVVMAAGAIMNIILAWVVFVGITMAQGVAVMPASTVVSEVIADSPAEIAGIQIGDKITRVIAPNGKEITPESSNEIVEFIQNYEGEFIYQIEREGNVLDLVIIPELNEEQGVKMIGITSSREIKEISWYESFYYGTQDMISSSLSIFRALSNLVQGVGYQNLSGPVGIFQVTAEITQNGLISTLSLLALLSLNLGIFNLVPIPILDGGRIFIILVEKLIGKKLSEKAETAIMMAGLVIIVGIMIFATWNDITRIFF